MLQQLSFTCAIIYIYNPLSISCIPLEYQREDNFHNDKENMQTFRQVYKREYIGIISHKKNTFSDKTLNNFMQVNKTFLYFMKQCGKTFLKLLFFLFAIVLYVGEHVYTAIVTRYG